MVGEKVKYDICIRTHCKAYDTKHIIFPSSLTRNLKTVAVFKYKFRRLCDCTVSFLTTVCVTHAYVYLVSLLIRQPTASIK